MTIARRLGRQLYVPALHLWYRPVRPSTAMSSLWTVEIGMTERGLTELGDITMITPQKQIRESVVTKEEILTLDWDTYVMKNMYDYEPHWAQVSGRYRLKSPVMGKVEYMIGSQQDIRSEDEVIVTLSTDADSLQAAIFPLVTREQYLEGIEAGHECCTTHTLMSCQSPQCYRKFWKHFLESDCDDDDYSSSSGGGGREDKDTVPHG